jgi:hypothetical protein
VVPAVALGSIGTALRWIQKYSTDLKAGGNLLMVSGVSDGVMAALEQSHVIDTVGADNVFKAQLVIQGSTDDALDAAGRWLNSDHEAAPTSADTDDETDPVSGGDG